MSKINWNITHLLDRAISNNLLLSLFGRLCFVCLCRLVFLHFSLLDLLIRPLLLMWLSTPSVCNCYACFILPEVHPLVPETLKSNSVQCPTNYNNIGKRNHLDGEMSIICSFGRRCFCGSFCRKKTITTMSTIAIWLLVKCGFDKMQNCYIRCHVFFFIPVWQVHIFLKRFKTCQTKKKRVKSWPNERRC